MIEVCFCVGRVRFHTESHLLCSLKQDPSLFRDPERRGVPGRVPGQEADGDGHLCWGEVCESMREADGDRVPATTILRGS